MNVLILGAAGFIGTNLTLKMAENKKNQITVVDKSRYYFKNIEKYNFSNIKIKESSLSYDMDFSVLENQDIVYHLVSTNIPTNSNQHIFNDIINKPLFSKTRASSNTRSRRIRKSYRETWCSISNLRTWSL